jgi:hypothetical protein
LGRAALLLHDVRAYWFTAIKPRNAVDLAYMCGVEVSDLPELLQHWHNRDDEPYTGNSILNRIDPLEWAIHPPWEKRELHGQNLPVQACPDPADQGTPAARADGITGKEERVPTVMRM